MIAMSCKKDCDRWMTTKWPCDNVGQSTKILVRVFVDDWRGWDLDLFRCLAKREAKGNLSCRPVRPMCSIQNILARSVIDRVE